MILLGEQNYSISHSALVHFSCNENELMTMHYLSLVLLSSSLLEESSPRGDFSKFLCTFDELWYRFPFYVMFFLKIILIKVIYAVPGCPSGTYFSGVSNCTLCPKDTYNNIDSHYMTKCTSCQEGHQTEGVGSTALTQCVCE